MLHMSGIISCMQKIKNTVSWSYQISAARIYMWIYNATVCCMWICFLAPSPHLALLCPQQHTEVEKSLSLLFLNFQLIFLYQCCDSIKVKESKQLSEAQEQCYESATHVQQQLKKTKQWLHLHNLAVLPSLPWSVIIVYKIKAMSGFKIVCYSYITSRRDVSDLQSWARGH